VGGAGTRRGGAMALQYNERVFGIKSNQIYSLAVTGPTNQKPQKPKIKTKHIKNEENQSTAAHL
jgi:hypothetical protein